MMARKRRNSKHREPIDDQDRAWLRGEDSGFTEFLPQEQLRALWDEYGDKENLTWTEGYFVPVARPRV